MTAMNDKCEAIIRMRNKIRCLIGTADPESELAQALRHSGQRNPCDQIVGKFLNGRVRRAHEAARRAASAATRKCWPDPLTEKYDTHKLTWDLLRRINLLLQEAELPPDDAITDFAREIGFTQIYNIAQYADSFADVAVKACTLAEATASTTASADRDSTRQPAAALLH
jgi:hypothetical protein